MDEVDEVGRGVVLLLFAAAVVRQEEVPFLQLMDTLFVIPLILSPPRPHLSLLGEMVVCLLPTPQQIKRLVTRPTLPLKALDGQMTSKTE